MPLDPLGSGSASADPRAAYPAAEPVSASPQKPGRVVFLGPPNAGKGTQAAMLREKLGVPGISTGELLRREAASGTPLGLRVKSIMETGGLVDDATMDEVVR
ncbi:MAG TPA: nucleoside monophosphate kinase, partial [Thermoanaerobaculia bacterium]|nr:nucleoside monophosphate kinase [Thermoanaerobaculia bacterium]